MLIVLVNRNVFTICVHFYCRLKYNISHLITEPQIVAITSLTSRKFTKLNNFPANFQYLTTF